MAIHQEALNPSDPLKGSDLKIVNHRDPNGRDFKVGYSELARFSDIEATRYVRFDAHVPVSDLLQDGEEAPEEAFQNLFARTRALYYAREECERVLESLASKCVVDRAKGKYLKTHVEVSGVLRFVQKSEFGAIDPAQTWAYETVSNDLSKRGKEVSLRSEEKERMSLYRKAVDECAATKKRSGNCAITDIGINLDWKPNDRKVRVRARARYSFLLGPGS